MFDIDRYLASASFWALPLAFIAGILTSVTPCVFPLIPIIASYLGSRGEQSKSHNLLLSLAYVIGMSIIYTVLGILAALTGRMFGSVQTNPIVNLMVGNIFILLGLSLLDVFRIPIPGFGKAASPSKAHGILGSFFLGFTSGFIAAPCTAAVFLAILTFVARSKDVLYGGAVMFCFALGLGFLLIIIGTFTGILASLPKSGKWTLVIQKVFAFLMIVTGEYFLIKTGWLWR